MYKVRNISSPHHVMNRAGIYYYVRRIPADLKQHYSVKRLCFSLRTKSHRQAMRTASSVHQRLEDYWLGLRLQQMNIPAIHLVKTDDVEDTLPLMMDKANVSSCFAFPRYTDNTRCNANSPSNALNKWLHANFRNDIVIHGFRHAMRDSLRAFSCPSEMIDQIGGWSSGKIGEGYGEGYSVLQATQWMTRLVLHHK